MKKRIALSVLGLFLVVGVLGGLKALQIRDLIEAGSAQQFPPTAITAADAQLSSWETTVRSIGTLEASQGVVISADSPGRVTGLFFDGGETVEKGDLLLTQESSNEDAQLKAAESDLSLAKNNYNRISRLFKNKVVSRSDFDSARSQLSAAQAQLDNITASLEKKLITAPFDGRLGLRLVDIGQELSQGVSIVSLQAFDPMRVNFSLPQKALASVREGLLVRIETNAVPGVVFDGKITAIDTEIDKNTRTVRTQATLQAKPEAVNTQNLLPGMFANVTVVLSEAREVLIIPITAVNFATYGDSVFVLEENDQEKLAARQQFVQLGERRGDFVEVTKGLEPGQRVANDGVFKLRNGATVIVNDKGSVPEIAPKPDNA